MKHFIKIISFLLILNLGHGLIVNKIKITGNSYTDSSVILYFALELKEGKEYTESELSNLASRIEERLKNTGWFYNAKVYISQASRGEDYRNVIIEVEEGFLYRFYGGNAYGGFGMDNLSGKGDAYRLELGYNRQLLRFTKLFPSFNTQIKGDLGNLNTTIYSNDREVNIQSAGIKSDIFYFLNPDFAFYLGDEYRKNFDISYNYLFDSYYPETGIVLDKRNKKFSPSKGYYLDLNYRYLSFSYHRFGIDARFFASLFENLTFATRLIFITEEVNVPYFYNLSIIGIDGVRANYSDSVGTSLVQANFEMRWQFYSVRLFSMINTIFELTAFLDAGKAFGDFEKIKEVENYAIATGLGLRIFFDNPVFLPVRLEAGFDKNFKLAFYFDVSYPF